MSELRDTPDTATSGTLRLKGRIFGEDRMQKWEFGYELYDYEKGEYDLDGIRVFPKYDRSKKGSYAVACRFQPDSDKDSLGDSARSVNYWEETDEEFMSLREFLVANARYFQIIGQYLNPKGAMQFP